MPSRHPRPLRLVVGLPVAQDAPSARPARLDLDIISRRVLTLLLLGILVRDVGIDLDHLERLMAQMPLQRKELAALEQEADGIPVAAGVGAHALVRDAAD